MRKIIVLYLALLLPGLIFLFLKFFGKNQFDVAPLYQQAGEPFPADCHIAYTVPYSIPDTVLQRFPFPSDDAFQIVAFNSDDLITTKQLNRIEEAFADSPVVITRLTKEKTSAIAQLRRCVFLLQAEQSVVLIDHGGSIRGQYEGASLEEMDRLVVELKILLKQY